ncbi:hypothetical protein ACP8HI_06780 [Paenibacillus sp. FA6]|uniref:hypothetical protein n=1 Tax=Paenibacillus sp. FA6 TaxID=3413029 RepID=UPI003F659CB2
MFGETQYSTAFMVSGVNSAGQGVAFKVKAGTTKVGVLIGFKSSAIDKVVTGSYTITDKEGQALSTGQINDNAVVDNVLVLPKNTTELQVTFKGPAGEKSNGFIIWDES